MNSDGEATVDLSVSKEQSVVLVDIKRVNAETLEVRIPVHAFVILCFCSVALLPSASLFKCASLLSNYSTQHPLQEHWESPVPRLP